MGALKKNESNPPIRIILSGIKKYDEEIFPRIENGEKVYNWWASFNAPYWFPQRGMWHHWNKFILIPTIIDAVVGHINNTALSIVWYSIFLYLFKYIAETANQDYYNYLKLNPDSVLKAKSGILGVVFWVLIYVAIQSQLGDFSPKMLGALNPMSSIDQINQLGLNDVADVNQSPKNLNKSTTDGSIPNQALQQNSSPKSTLNVGDPLNLKGSFWGLSIVQDKPVMTVKFELTNVIWFVTISEQNLAQAKNWKNGDSININCTITMNSSIHYCDWK